MGVHMPPSPMPYQASRRGGRSRHGRTLRNGIAGPAAVVQPQRRQRHAESAARTSEWRCRAQAPRCRCARAARHRPPPSGGQDPPPRSRLERHGGISMLTPEQVHFGNADQVIAGREAVLREAWAAHPDRFVSGEPKPKPLPEAVWINPPTPSLTTQEIAL